MDHAHLLELYDREERRDALLPDARREATAHVVRQINPSGRGSTILYSHLNEANAEKVIDEEIEYFNRLQLGFEWKVFDHDAPADLRQRLEKRGLVLETPEAVMVLDLEANSVILRPSTRPEVRRVSDPRELVDVVSVQNEVWGEDHDCVVGRLAVEMELTPDKLSVYVASAADLPVSTGWVRFSAHGKFASLWGGSTLPAFRHRGFYTALVQVRLAEAARRGFRFVTVDALPTSQPILEKRGFTFLTGAQACRWGE